MNTTHSFELTSLFLTIKVKIDYGENYIVFDRVSDEFTTEHLIFTSTDTKVVDYLINNNIVKAFKIEHRPNQKHLIYRLILTQSAKLEIL